MHQVKRAIRIELELNLQEHDNLMCTKDLCLTNIVVTRFPVRLDESTPLHSSSVKLQSRPPHTILTIKEALVTMVTVQYNTQ